MYLSDGFTDGDVVIGPGASELFGEGDGESSVGDADAGDAEWNVGESTGESADDVGLVQKRQDRGGVDGVEYRTKSCDSTEIEESAAMQRGHGDGVLLQCGGEWAGIAQADDVDLPVFLFQSGGDANECFFCAADIEFGDDHAQGAFVRGLDSRWVLGMETCFVVRGHTWAFRNRWATMLAFVAEHPAGVYYRGWKTKVSGPCGIRQKMRL